MFIEKIKVNTPNKYRNTFLRDFISSRLRDYMEPSRKGTPKGHEIGLSKIKYHATLLALTNMRQKDVAHKLRISYGLLRKWHTESVFQNTLEKHVSDFVANTFEKIREIYYKNLKEDSDGFISSKKASELVGKKLADIDQYNTSLYKSLISTLLRLEYVETREIRFEEMFLPVFLISVAHMAASLVKDERIRRPTGNIIEKSADLFLRVILDLALEKVNKDATDAAKTLIEIAICLLDNK
jgi:hypothetical protein